MQIIAAYCHWHKEGRTGYLGHFAFVTQGGTVVGKSPGAVRRIQSCLDRVSKEESGAGKVINLP